MMKIDQRGIRVQDDFKVEFLDLNGNSMGIITVEARDPRSAVRKALNGYLSDDIALVQTFVNLISIYRVGINGHAILIGTVKRSSE